MLGECVGFGYESGLYGGNGFFPYVLVAPGAYALKSYNRLFSLNAAISASFPAAVRL